MIRDTSKEFQRKFKFSHLQ